MSEIRLLLCAALICSSALANAEEFSGKVIAVLDGDTVLVLRSGHPVKVRLAEIDAPEKAQPFGMASQKSLAEMVKDEQIRVVSDAVDDYGRLIAKVYVGEFNVNYEQVWRGMAWEYSRFHGNRKLVELQREAQRAKRGLWAKPGAVEPSQWRRQHPGSPPAQHSSSVPPASAPATRSDPPAGRSSGQDCRKNYCTEMSSCEEAMYYFSACGKRTLDSNADGVPCERLCSAAQKQAGGAD